jgi:hypothetical protein
LRKKGEEYPEPIEDIPISLDPDDPDVWHQQAMKVPYGWPKPGTERWKEDREDFLRRESFLFIGLNRRSILGGKESGL